MDLLHLPKHSPNSLPTPTQDGLPVEHKRRLNNREPLKRLYHASPEKKHFVKIFIAKFLRWSEWQRNIVLCGITERCSRELLRVLVTVLSPYFLRRAKRYKSCRNEKRRKERFDMLERTAVQVTFPQDEGGEHKTNEDSAFLVINNRSTVALTTSGITINESISDVTSNASGERAHFNAENCNQDKTGELFIDCIKKDTKIRFKGEEDRGSILPSVTLTLSKACNEDVAVDIEPSNDDQVRSNECSQSSFHNCIENRPRDLGIDNNYCLAQRDSNYFPPSKEKSVLNNSTFVVLGTGSQRDLDNQEFKTGKKTGRVVTSNRNSKKKSKRVHSHAAAVIGSVPSSKVLLPPIEQQKLEKLGPFMASTCKNRMDLHSIKNQQWWLPSTDCSCLVKPTRSALFEGFNNDINDLWKVFVYWSNAEKGDCILEICAACTIRELKHFADCVRQRLKEKDDFERLSADIVLKIFDYMDARTLCIASQVCSRWKILGNADVLWERKAKSHAQKVGCERLLKEEVDHGVWKSKTWKEIYKDLAGIFSNEKVLNSLSNKMNLKEQEAGGCPSNKLRPSSSERPNLKASSGERKDLAPRKDSAAAVSNDAVPAQDASKTLHTSPPLSSEGTTLVALVDTQPKSIYRRSIKDDFLEGTLSTVSRNLKRTPTYINDYEQNDVVIDLRTNPVQAHNELKTAEKETTKDASGSFSVVSVPGVFPLKQVKNLRGHFGGVMALYSDAKRVMTAGGDHIIRVWDVRSGVKIQELEGHKGGVRSVLFDKEYIYSGSWDMSIIVWDVVKFVAVDTLLGHTDCVSCLEMSDNLLISGSHDCSIMVWEKSTRTLLRKLTGHKGPINCLALADTENLYSGGADGTVLHWNLQTGNSWGIFSSCRDSYNAIKVCGDLIATGSASGNISFWDRRSKKCEASIKAHEGSLNALCLVVPRFLTAGNDCVIKEWDLSTCACLRTLKGHKRAIRCLRASGRRIISGSLDNTARIWDLGNYGQQVSLLA